MKMKKRLRLLVATFLALAFALNVFAQQVIRGTLRAPSGEPLVGATVTVKGTKNSVVTDGSGNFAISAPVGSTLTVSYVGFASQDVAVTDTNPLNIQLQASNQELQQVVVIGYQTVRRRDLTGAIGS